MIARTSRFESHKVIPVYRSTYYLPRRYMPLALGGLDTPAVRDGHARLSVRCSPRPILRLSVPFRWAAADGVGLNPAIRSTNLFSRNTQELQHDRVGERWHRRPKACTLITRACALLVC